MTLNTEKMKEEINLSKHKHNYSQYSNKNRDNNVNHETKHAIAKEVSNPIAGTPEVKMDSTPASVVPPKPQSTNTLEVVPPKPQLVQETVETKTIPTNVEGTVVGCAKLNVRSDASLFADVVCTLDVMSEMMIDINKSTKDWFFVCTATGIEGYCMRKFVEAHL